MSFPARKNADRILALLAQGNALASKAQYLDAIKCYDKVLAAAPGNLDAINNRGNCLSLLGQFAEAIKSYNAIIAARPNDLRARCNRANALKQLGVQKGTRVAIYMGMIPELAVAMLACARLGAPHTVVFGGFSADALADRINDMGCEVLVTQDEAWRRGSPWPNGRPTRPASISISAGTRRAGSLMCSATPERSRPKS